jgi:hypothetical protein
MIDTADGCEGSQIRYGKGRAFAIFAFKTQAR